MSGYVKIHRKITEWEWYGDPVTRSVFLHLLFIANWKDGRFKGVDIPRGSAAVSVQKMADELGYSRQQMRTALEHLKSTNEVTIKGYTKFSVITVNNYSLYQDDNQQANQQPTNDQPTTNQQVTTIEESNKERRKESNNIPPIIPPQGKPTRHKYGEYHHVLLSDDDYQKLCSEFGESIVQDAICKVDEYCETSGKTYKNYNLVIRRWGIDRAREDARGKANRVAQALQDSYDMMREWAEGG